MVTDEQLAEWRRLTEAATAGVRVETTRVYRTHGAGNQRLPGAPFDVEAQLHAGDRWLATYHGADLMADAEFHAAARTAMPALLGEVARLKQQLARREPLVIKAVALARELLAEWEADHE